MAETNSPHDRWIVILNKKPHGPLSREEIHVLLAQGVLRTNDVAFRVLPENSTARADWKFLWQFTEFDRRKGRLETKEPERRKQAPAPVPEPVHLLPEEYAGITPEELILKTKPLAPRENKESKDELNPPASQPATEPSRSSSAWIGAAGVSLTLALGYLGFRIFTRPGAPPTAAPEITRQIAPRTNDLPTRNSLLNSGSMRLPTSTTVPAPAEPPARAAMPPMREERAKGERGAVRYDADEEALRAAEMDEEEMSAEEAEELNTPALEGRRKKKIAKKKKKPVREEASTEEDSEDQGEIEAEIDE